MTRGGFTSVPSKCSLALFLGGAGRITSYCHESFHNLFYHNSKYFAPTHANDHLAHGKNGPAPSYMVVDTRNFLAICWSIRLYCQPLHGKLRKLRRAEYFFRPSLGLEDTESEHHVPASSRAEETEQKDTGGKALSRSNVASCQNVRAAARSSLCLISRHFE